MRHLKALAISLAIWIIGILLCGAWMMWDLEKHPVAPNADGSIPDSMMIPLMGFAVLWVIFLVVANTARWIFRRMKRQKSAF
jgi:hypothetical protein